MTEESMTNVTTYSLLGLTAIVSLALPQSLFPQGSAQVAGDQRPLKGIVRDFRDAHVDFDVSATGHYAGNIALSVDDDGRPVFVGSGRQVVAQWYDDAGRPIPSHLYRDSATPRLGVDTKFIVENNCFVDSFDSRNGPYGGANISSEATLSMDSVAANAVHFQGDAWFRGDVLIGSGGDPTVVVNNVNRVTGSIGSLPQPINLPVIEMPTDMGPYLGDQDFNAVTMVINTNTHWGDVRMEATQVTIDGDVTILVDDLDIDDTVNNFIFLPDSSLKLYCTGWMEIDNDAQINMNTGIPSQLTIYMMGTFDGSGDEEEIGLLDIEDGAQVTADIVAPNGKMLLDNGCDVYGTFVGKSVEITDDSRVHVDLAVFSTGCATGDGAAGSAGVTGNGGIFSAASFSQWYDDRLGVNLSDGHAITMIHDGTAWEYLDDAFYPIDGELFGNEGESHNSTFTYGINATFTYNACGGQFVDFRGGDGAWLFIDGQLVMDLGGVAPGTSQHIDLDRLDLADGEEHSFQLFYASRAHSGPMFRLRTNIDLAADAQVATVTTPFD